ncbi:hypothetical protein ABI245_19845 [Serratia ureilytica]|uniref:hypothetical protein n=2 Tax=Serratia ureilytica TaxID=300181 RepID=UPI003267A7FB
MIMMSRIKSFQYLILSLSLLSFGSTASTAQKIDDLEYKPYQVMTDAELNGTKGKAIPVVLVPILWAAAQGATVNLSAYLAQTIGAGNEVKFNEALAAAAVGAGIGAIGGVPLMADKFLLTEAGGLLFGGLAGEYLGKNKNKVGPALDSVPSQADLNKILNDPSWGESHFKNMPGLSGGRYKEAMQKAVDDPASWNKLMKQRCTACH